MTAWYGTSWCPTARTALDLGSGIGTVGMICAWCLAGAKFVTVEAQSESVVIASKSAQAISRRIALLRPDEQFGCGFSFTVYLPYMIHIASDPPPTAHYAICTRLMVPGVMLPSLWSGWLLEIIGCRPIFVWVLMATIPSFILAAKSPLEEEFGSKV